MKTSFIEDNLKRPRKKFGDEDRGPKVFHVLAGGPWGGGAVVVLALTQALIQIGCQVWVLCLEDLVAHRFAEAGAQVVRCDTWRREISPLRDLITCWQLFRFCLRKRFDLVVTHTSKGGFLGRIAARLAGVPRIIHTAHGFAWHEFTSSAATRFYTMLERIAAHFCDLVISVNHEDRLDAINRQIVSPEKIVTVPNGIDVNRFSAAQLPTLRQQLAGTRDSFVIGAVGRLAPQKGFKYLILAMPAILAKYPNCRLVVVGSGPLETKLRSLACLCLPQEVDRCEFLGFRTDIPELLGCFDVFVQSSLWEGLSITLLEAMAAAKPIVATDIKGTREVITDGVDGLLIEPADPTALADAIVELLQNRERARMMGIQARETIRQHFSQEAMVQNTLQLYKLPLNDQAAQIDQASRLKPHPESVAGHRV
jgi:glycosyltransferase involved in cell wall biosynthesis